LLLDPGTLYFAAVVVAITATLTCAIGQLTNARVPGLGWVTGGFALPAAAGSFAFFLQGQSPSPITLGAVITGYFGGVILLASGILLMTGRAPLWRLHFGIAVPASALVMLSLFWPDTVTTRLTVVFFAMGAIKATTLPSLLRRDGPAALRTPWMAVVAIGTGLAFDGIRVGLLLADLGGGPVLTSETIFMAGAVGQLFALMIAMASIMQIVGDRLMMRIQSANAFLDSAFQAASDGFALFDASSRLVAVNQRARDLFPDLGNELIAGAGFAGVFGSDPPARGFTTELLVDLGSGRTVMRFERVSQPRDGLWLRVLVLPTAPGGFVVCWSDISDFKQAEMLLEQELRREREQARLRAGFINMASHEFRTPLTIIDLAAQRLASRLRQLADPGSRETIAQIRGAVSRIIRLIETMLGASVSGTGALDMRPESCDLAVLVTETCERATVSGMRPRVVRDLDRLPPRIDCDPGLIEHAFGNLLANAGKYAPKNSTIRVVGRMVDEAVLLSVSDEGIGIRREDQDLIFEQHYRAANALSYPGTGMGLSVVREIARIHGGDVTVESEPGLGATFTLRLPVRLGSEGSAPHRVRIGSG
jgi:signal transduction histidine kinase